MVVIVREEGQKGKPHQQLLRRPLQATSRKGFMRGKGGPENTSCPYKGVRQRTWGKWVAEIREPNNGARVWLGTFATSLEAAIAYDAAARKLYGSNVRLNLPDAVITSAQQMAEHVNKVQIQNLGAQMNYPPSLGTEMPNSQNPPTQMHTQEQTHEDQNMVLDINDFLDSVDFDLDLNMPVETAHQAGGGDQAAVYGSNINYHQESTDWLDFATAGLGDLDLNLPEFEYSSIGDEAAATHDFQTDTNDPGIFAASFDEGVGIGTGSYWHGLY